MSFRHPRCAGTTAVLAVALLGGCGDDSLSGRVVGQLESERIELVAEVSEPITARRVVEGERVSAGTVITEQDEARIRARLREAQATLAQSRARLEELIRGPRQEQIVAVRANVAGAREELQYRRLDYERALEVEARGLAAPDTLDRAEAALESARAALEFQEARLEELLAGTTVEELRQAESVVKQHEARIAGLDVDAARHRLTAPVDGIVDTLLFEIGERPPVGQPVAILLAGSQPYARVYVPESLRASVAAGDEALVRIDGIAEPFEGRVRWVASDAAFTPYFALTERDRGRLSYFAKIDILGADRRLPDGLPVEVEFPVPRR